MIAFTGIGVAVVAVLALIGLVFVIGAILEAMSR